MNGEVPKVKPIDVHVHLLPATELPDVVVFHRMGIPLDIATKLQRVVRQSDVFRDAIDLLRHVLRAYDVTHEIVDDMTEGESLHQSLKDVISIALTGSGPTESTLRRILHFLDLIDSNFPTVFEHLEYEVIETGVPSVLIAQIDFSQIDLNAGNYSSFHKYAQVHKFGPFKAWLGVNPFNDRSLQTLETVAQTPDLRNAFVGVKLYPPLGWYPSVHDVRNRRLFQLLESLQWPILVHASKGGIRTQDDQGDFANPRHWYEILDFFNVKVVFAHFGGNNDFLRHFLHNDTHNNWTSTIANLMTQYPDRVFADLAFHQSSVLEPSKYFQALNNALNDPSTSNGILFGSDYPLHLPLYDYPTLIDAFTTHLTTDQIKTLNANVQRVLEFPV